MPNRKLFILGARVDPVTIDEARKMVIAMVEREFFLDRKQHYIVTANPEIVLHSFKNWNYRRIIEKASLSLADGIGLRLTAFLFGQSIPQRLTGVDFMVEICRLAEQNRWPVFFLGGYDSALGAARNLARQIPGLKIAGTDAGQEFKVVDGGLMTAPAAKLALAGKINSSGAKILFVALGAPKQEMWMAENLPGLTTVKAAMGVGGAFDFISGRSRRAPVWLRQAGLEWLHRLAKEPWRLKRVFNATFKFISLVIMCRIRMATTYRRNVAAAVLNDQNQILLVAPTRNKRFLWQFPQGGVERRESRDKAIFREMTEELGTNKFKIIKALPNIYAYTWPKWAQCLQCYRGQKQTLYIMRFSGKDSDFDFGKENELKAFRWVNQTALLKTIDRIRRPLAIKFLGELKKLG